MAQISHDRGDYWQLRLDIPSASVAMNITFSGTLESKETVRTIAYKGVIIIQLAFLLIMLMYIGHRIRGIHNYVKGITKGTKITWYNNKYERLYTRSKKRRHNFITNQTSKEIQFYNAPTSGIIYRSSITCHSVAAQQGFQEVHIGSNARADTITV